MTVNSSFSAAANLRVRASSQIQWHRAKLRTTATVLSLAFVGVSACARAMFRTRGDWAANTTR